VDVIVATGSSAAALAAKAATKTTPIVFTTGSDPVQLGLVASLSRPGGNITGATVLAVELGAKRLELLHELVPTATNIALLVNPTNPTTEAYISDARTAARAFGIQLHVLHASTEGEFDKVLATLARMRADGLVITADPFLFSRTEQLATPQDEPGRDRIAVENVRVQDP
jgi:putative ABC transport system substrate-binding protein